MRGFLFCVYCVAVWVPLTGAGLWVTVSQMRVMLAAGMTRAVSVCLPVSIQPG